jgi:hypothetical protein
MDATPNNILTMVDHVYKAVEDIICLERLRQRTLYFSESLCVPAFGNVNSQFITGQTESLYLPVAQLDNPEDSPILLRISRSMMQPWHSGYPKRSMPNAGANVF